MSLHLLERPAPQHRATAPQASPAPERAGLRRAGRVLRTAGRWTLNLALVAGIVAFLGLAVGPHIFGYRTITMLTQSMTPMIEPGDVVVTFPKPVDEVAVGDVITYHIPVEDQRVETHRVTEVIERRNGDIAVKTKGDANDAEDYWTATLEGDTVWETRYVVPNVGHAIRALRHPWVQDYAWYAALGGVLLIGLRSIWGRSDEDEPTPAAPTSTADESPETAVITSPLLEDAFDVTALRKLAADLADDDFVASFAGRYQQLLPTRVDRIATALTTADLDAALDASLSLKVASTTVGTTELHDLAEVIELNVRRQDLAAARDLAGSLAAAAARADAALTAYLRDERNLVGETERSA
ncbi:signal peptidase I [Nocardioides ferulae]|uniref:signal peptidase I n=1 Tax=Nocardioides ferulae TaxID=2340821 RepID=UPI001981E01C|nr:signal peptidase I [Nocardioides ferulae]